MEPRVNVITLAVGDLERALEFYRDGLGFASDGIVGTEWRDPRTGANGAISLFHLDHGLLLNLYPRTDLVLDAGFDVDQPQTSDFSLGQLVRSSSDVDEVLHQAEAAGAAVTPAHNRPWGIYSGYFRDLDGHLWEIIWNPGRS